MTKIARSLFLIILIALVSGCDPVADSHTTANVPPAEKFDTILKRDLERYFTTRLGKPARVEYELLRRGPTQTGISYPKFYVWVRAVDAGTGQELAVGAVRLAAIDRVRFDITDFVPKATVVADATQIESVFPKPVCDEIRKRAF